MSVTQFLVIEETSADNFVSALEKAAGAGFSVVASNLSPSRYENEIIYYALMGRNIPRPGIRDIPVLDLD